MSRHRDRHMVHGECMTVYEASKRLGVAVGTIQQWRYHHRHPDGTAGTMTEAWNWFDGVKHGIIRHRGPAGVERRYWVDGHYMTVAEAAGRAGTDEATLRRMMRRGCTLQKAVKHFERARVDTAVKEIMGIIYGGD